MIKLRLLSGCLLFGSLGLLSLGCGGSNPMASARVSGKLTYNGQPIRAALMEMHLPDNRKFSVTVNTDGTYQATDIPAGELIVTVDTEAIKGRVLTEKQKKEAKQRGNQGVQPPPPGRGAPTPDPEQPSAEYMKIPAKYAKANTSPLTVTLKSGRQVHDIELTD